MKRYRLPALLLCGVLMTGCAAQPAQEEGSGSAEKAENIVISQLAEDTLPLVGGSALLELPGNLAAAAAFGESYETASADTAFTYTSDNAWQALMDGELDLILAYAPTQEQQDKLTEGGYLQQEVGLDALVFLAGESPDGIALTREQLLAAYTTPETAEWHGYSSAPNTTSRQQFAQVFGASAVGMQVQLDGNTLTAACPHTAQTLCYTTWLSLLATEKPANTGVVAVDGVLPNAETISENSPALVYPLTMPYYVACRGDLAENDATMLLYRWLTSEQGMEWLSVNGGGYAALLEK